MKNVRPARRYRVIAMVAVFAAIAGCSGNVRTEVSSLGGAAHPIAQPRSYRIADVPEADAHYATLRALLDERLQGAGYTPAGGDDFHYLVQLAYTVRPANVGTYGDSQPASKEAAGWLSRPAGSESKSAYGVAIHISDRASGRELYRVAATETHKEGDFAAVAPHLLDGALGQFPYAEDGTRVLERPRDR